MALTGKQQEAVNLMKEGKMFVKRKVHDTPSTIKIIYKVGDARFTEATFRALIHKGIIRYYEGTYESEAWVLNVL